MKTWADFVKALYLACESKRQAPPSDALLTMFKQVAERNQISWDLAIECMSRFVENPDERFAPVPSDLIKYTKGTGRDQLAALEGQAAHQWGRVLEMAERVGSYQSVIFDDWRTMAAVKAVGGWITVCQAPQDQLSVLQANFRRAYTHAKQDNYPAVLPGLFSGQPGHHPTTVGNSFECSRILLQGRGLEALGQAQLVSGDKPKQLAEILQFPKAPT